MVAILAGERLTPKEKSRVTLSVRSPLISNLLAGMDIEGDVNALHAFGKRLVRDRNQWDIERRRGGLFGSGRRLTKADAERAWRKAFASSDGGDV